MLNRSDPAKIVERNGRRKEQPKEDSKLELHVSKFLFNIKSV